MANALDLFTDAYIEALYFTDTGEDEQPPHDAEISPELRASIDSDCAAFWTQFRHMIQRAKCFETSRGPYDKAEQAGHDFWLTRNGHGAGFWDGDWSEPFATYLTDAATQFGPCETYLGDDGLIHA